MNYHVWARENLSTPRARAFSKALSEIDNSKWSEEYKEARLVVDGIEHAHAVAVQAQLEEIAVEAEAQAAELRNQLRGIQSKLTALYNDAEAARMKVRTAVYASPEYVAAADKVSELWQRDDDAVEPLRQALVEKYSKAQAKVGA
jgi:hypothetical protein